VRYFFLNKKTKKEKGMSATTHTQDPAQLYPVSARPPLDRPVRLGVSIVVYTGYGRSVRIGEDDPSFFGGHLLGHEGDMGCYCYYRPATEEEAAEVEARERGGNARAADRRARKIEMEAIRRHIRTQGERPAEKQDMPAGETLLDSFDLYGYGTRFVITPDHIWFIANNGADGADWSANNVITGGAGAIGWRVPYAPELAERLRAVAGKA
jgi:hypothetical protein